MDEEGIVTLVAAHPQGQAERLAGQRLPAPGIRLAVEWVVDAQRLPAGALHLTVVADGRAVVLLQLRQVRRVVVLSGLVTGPVVRQGGEPETRVAVLEAGDWHEGVRLSE